ncbi:MAG: glycosyltransferase family 2 protein [Acidobacteriota bacterium]|nr:MAG: glycosyltransferase family 2 protein [Acidobacteriota bacterium]
MKSEPPLVSIGIPLYRSRRFLESIIANLERISYPRLEIIISDRHSADDTIDLLREHFKGDSRFSFVQEQDDLNWVENYNELLRRFSGDYFLWMPHDDIYPADYVSKLVAGLETDSEAICSFGRLHLRDLEDRPIPLFREFPPAFLETEDKTRRALALLTWGAGIPFRGLFRRNPIVESSFFIRQTLDNYAADGCWMFGLALRRRFVYVRQCSVHKRMYPNSTHRRIDPGIRHQFNYLRTIRDYLKDGCSDRLEVAAGTLFLGIWIFGVRVHPVAPRFLRGRLRRLVTWLLA